MKKTLMNDIILCLLLVSLFFGLPLGFYTLLIQFLANKIQNRQVENAVVLYSEVTDVLQENKSIKETDIIETLKSDEIINNTKLRLRLVDASFNCLYDNEKPYDFFDFLSLSYSDEIENCFKNNKLVCNIRDDYYDSYQKIIYFAYPFSYAADSSPDFVIYISAPTIKIDLSTNVKLLLFTTCFLVIVSFVMAFILKKKIISPMILLSEETAKAADENGKFSNTILYGNEREDEIGLLSKSFTKVIEKVNYRINEIENLSSDLSHEIKKPLSVIANIADFLNSENLTEEEKKEFSKTIINETKKINNIISRIRESAKIENRIYEANKEIIDLDSYIENFTVTFLENYPTLKIIKDLNLSENKIEINPELLNLLFSNLLTNASDFANSIKISTNLSLEPDIIIQIEDNGPGIPQEEREKVFMRFYSKRNEEEESKHDGLGLYLVKYIINSLNGSIQIEDSKELGGANFIIKLPLYKIYKRVQR